MLEQKEKEIFINEILIHLDRIYSSAVKMTKEKQLAEDLTQEVFRKAYESFYRYKSGTNVIAWLFKILTNTYITEYRKKNIQPETVSMNEYESDDEFYVYNKIENLNKNNEPVENILNKFTSVQIKNAIDNLSEDFRFVTILCLIEGFSYNEVSQMLSIPVGTVRSRLNRARHILQNKLWNFAIELGFIKEDK